MPRVTINGAELHYAERGTSVRPVVMAHGFMFDHRAYDAQMTALSERHRCVAFDWRGQGESQVATSGYDVDALTADAAALVERLDLAPCHFVGTSMGGFVALRLAARRPELVRSIALLSTSYRGEEPGTRALALAAMGLALGTLGPAPIVGGFMSGVFSPRFMSGSHRAAARALWAARLRSVDRDGARRTLRGVVTHPGDVRAELGRVRVPALVIAGADDRDYGPAVGRALADALPDAELHVLDGVAHCPAIEAPEEVTALLSAFFERVDRSAKTV